MKKILIAGTAALSMLYASAAHADDDTLPNTDPLIGSWCLAKMGDSTLASTYKRENGNCDGKLENALTILQVGYADRNLPCAFIKLERLPNRNGWSAISECVLEGVDFNHETEFWITGKTLSYRSKRITNAANY
jgi:hypothetical protein